VATRRHFTQEYKDQAVSFVIYSGRSIADVARSIVINETTLGVRVNKARGEGRTGSSELSEPERAELERLRGDYDQHVAFRWRRQTHAVRQVLTEVGQPTLWLVFRAATAI